MGFMTGSLLNTYTKTQHLNFIFANAATFTGRDTKITNVSIGIGGVIISTNYYTHPLNLQNNLIRYGKYRWYS